MVLSKLGDKRFSNFRHLSLGRDQCMLAWRAKENVYIFLLPCNVFCFLLFLFNSDCLVGTKR